MASSPRENFLFVGVGLFQAEDPKSRTLDHGENQTAELCRAVKEDFCFVFIYKLILSVGQLKRNSLTAAV